METPYWIMNAIKNSSLEEEDLRKYKDVVSKKLNIENDETWRIYSIDTENKLVLFHYIKDFPKMFVTFPNGRMIKNPVKNIRGLVFDMNDINNPVLCASSKGYISDVIMRPDDNDKDKDVFFLDIIKTQSIINDPTFSNPIVQESSYTAIKVKEETFKGQDNKKNIFQHITNYEIKFGFEGAIIRIFMFNGKVYFSSHRSLDATNDSWAESPKYEQLYKDLGGPAYSELFDMTKKYSPYCYTFQLCHPSLYISSKIKAKKPFIVYYGAEMMWDPNNCRYPIDQISLVLCKPKCLDDIDKIYSFLCGEIDNVSLIVNPTLYSSAYGQTFKDNWETDGKRYINTGLISKILNDGYDKNPQKFSDSNLKFGEFLNIYKYNKNPIYPDAYVEDVIKLVSKSYYWRYLVRDEKQDLQNRGYYLIGYVNGNIKHNYTLFNTRMNYVEINRLRRLKDENINKESLYWSLEGKSKNDMNDVNARVKNVLQIFLYSLPWEQQKKAAKLIDDYYNSIVYLKEYLRENPYLTKDHGHYMTQLYELLLEVDRSKTRAISQFVDNLAINNSLLFFNVIKELQEM